MVDSPTVNLDHGILIQRTLSLPPPLLPRETLREHDSFTSTPPRRRLPLPSCAAYSCKVDRLRAAVSRSTIVLRSPRISSASGPGQIRGGGRSIAAGAPVDYLCNNGGAHGGHGRGRRGRERREGQMVRDGGSGGAGAVPAGARAVVPRMDAGPGADGCHRVGAPHPRAGVRRPPLVDPPPPQLCAVPLLLLICFDLVLRCHVLIDSVGFVFA
jgi:hypothetical protein